MIACCSIATILVTTASTQLCPLERTGAVLKRCPWSSSGVQPKRDRGSERSLNAVHAILCTLHCTKLRELTREVFRRRFAPNGGSRHEHRRHEETADDRDKRATRARTRTPDPRTRVRTLRGTRQEARSRARRLAPREGRNQGEKISNRYRLITLPRKS